MCSVYSYLRSDDAWLLSAVKTITCDRRSSDVTRNMDLLRFRLAAENCDQQMHEDKVRKRYSSIGINSKSKTSSMLRMHIHARGSQSVLLKTR